MNSVSTGTALPLSARPAARSVTARPESPQTHRQSDLDAWEPDLNDGVRLNIRSFLSVPDVGKKGAGIPRWRPNIKWDKDCGKDIPAVPRHPVFNGDRINDHHLTLKDKRDARKG